MAQLAHFVGDPHLAERRLFQRQLENDGFDLGRGPVAQQRLPARQLLQRHLAAGVVQLLEAVEAVARVAHHLAGLADVAQLLGELQQPHFAADDFLVLGHVGVLKEPEPGAA